MQVPIVRKIGRFWYILISNIINNLMTQIGDICGSKICARVHVNLTNKHE